MRCKYREKSLIAITSYQRWRRAQNTRTYYFARIVSERSNGKIMQHVGKENSGSEFHEEDNRRKKQREDKKERNLRGKKDSNMLFPNYELKLLEFFEVFFSSPSLPFFFSLSLSSIVFFKNVRSALCILFSNVFLPFRIPRVSAQRRVVLLCLCGAFHLLVQLVSKAISHFFCNILASPFSIIWGYALDYTYMTEKWFLSPFLKERYKKKENNFFIELIFVHFVHFFRYWWKIGINRCHKSNDLFQKLKGKPLFKSFFAKIGPCVWMLYI